MNHLKINVVGSDWFSENVMLANRFSAESIRRKKRKRQSYLRVKQPQKINMSADLIYIVPEA